MLGQVNAFASGANQHPDGEAVHCGEPRMTSPNIRNARSSTGRVVIQPDLQSHIKREHIGMNENLIDHAVMARLAKSLIFICGADHPTTKALTIAVDSRTAEDIKRARSLFLRLKPSDRRAALAMIED